MSDKYIPYGPGCEIDPIKLQERLDKGFMHYPEQRLWTALQQREEREKLVIDKCHLLLERYQTKQQTNLRAMICEHLQQLIDILEGTDGE